MTDRTRNRLVGVAVGAAVATAATPALAMDSFFVGARGQGMAGSLTASTDDVDAQYYNPAAYGFFGKEAPDGGQLATDNQNLREKHFGIGVDVGAGARVHGDLYEYADRLSDTENLDQYDDTLNADQAKDLVGLLGDLNGIGNPENGLIIDANGGMGMRFALPWAWAPQGLGARTYNQMGIRGQIDTANIKDIYGSDTDFDRAINDALDSDYSGETSFNQESLNDEQAQVLKDANLSDDTIGMLDSALADSDVTEDQINEAVKLIDEVYGSGTYSGATLSGANSLDDNDSALMVKGVSVQEVPFTWAWSWNDVSYVGGEWALGTNIKLMRGVVFGKPLLVFDDTDIGDQVDEAWNNREITNTVGVDVGFMGRYEMFQVGLMARNINSPSFDGPSYEDSTGNQVDVDSVSTGPQVRAGAAFMPISTLTLEGDIDLTRNQTMLDEYETQFASLGLEWDALSVLALRGGIYNNIADDDIGNVYTAGLGLNLWLARIDLGGAVSAERETVDGNKVPTEARANLEVTFDW